MSTTESRVQTAQRVRARQVPVNLVVAIWVWVNGRIDARLGIPYVAADALEQSVSGLTPFTARIGTRANEYATIEGLRFKADIHDEWLRWDAVTRDRERLVAARASLLNSASQSKGHSEAQRRLDRRIAAATKALPSIAAAINGSFAIAQLRAERYFDHSDGLIALYWRTVRRRHPEGHGLQDHPPVLVRPTWVSMRDGVSVLDSWNDVANAPEGN